MVSRHQIDQKDRTVQGLLNSMIGGAQHDDKGADTLIGGYVTYEASGPRIL